MGKALPKIKFFHRTTTGTILNMEPRIAIIGAIKDEIAGIKQEMQITHTLRWKTGNAFVGEWQGMPIVLVRSGMGRDRARQALIELTEKWELKEVFSIGYAGALDPSLEVGDLVFADKVLEVEVVTPENTGKNIEIYNREDYFFMRPELNLGTLLTVDRVVATPEEKKQLRDTYSAVAVDMETSALVKEAKSRNIRIRSYRAITDTAKQELIDCSHLVAEDGDVSKLKAGWHVITHPGDLKGMIELGRHAKIATANLTEFLKSYFSSKKD
jgi:adenosylhomocysteine nucleosidase